MLNIFREPFLYSNNSATFSWVHKSLALDTDTVTASKHLVSSKNVCTSLHTKL